MVGKEHGFWKHIYLYKKKKLKKQQQGKKHFSIPQVLTHSHKEKKKFMKSQPVLAYTEG